MAEIVAMRAMVEATERLLVNEAHTAVKYLSPTLTVRVSRPHYKGRPSNRSTELIVNIGRPNYKARSFIKLAQKAGESFPIRKVQLTFPVQPGLKAKKRRK